VRETVELLTDSNAYARMARGANPYGDGHAAERVAELLERHEVCTPGTFRQERALQVSLECRSPT
jgi:UDP-N-acetylglucosamine 2-epimerase